MTLDSKDSDIEQLRSQLQSLHIGLDNSSIGSGPGDAEADDGFPGMYFLVILLFSSVSCNSLGAEVLNYPAEVYMLYLVFLYSFVHFQNLDSTLIFRY